MASENGQDQRETLEEIVAEMRREVGDGNDTYCGKRVIRRMEDARLMQFCDRIEAAWKREKSEIEANALCVGGIVETASGREAVTNCNHIGNAAAMYGALKEIHDRVNSLDEECGVDPVEIRDLARAALSKPARNCDKYSDKNHAKALYNLQSETLDPFEWLYATEEKGGVE